MKKSLVKTRSIYRKSGSIYRLAHQDQTGAPKLTLVFHSADTVLKTSYDIKFVHSTTYTKIPYYKLLLRRQIMEVK